MRSSIKLPATVFLILLFTFFPAARFAQKLNLATLETVTKQLRSVNVQDRKNAIKTIQQSASEEDLDLLRLHLPLETDESAAKLILDLFARRKNRKDFYSIIDYLKTTRSSTNAKSGLNTLYAIHPTRLRQEIEFILRSGVSSFPLLLIYIEAIQNPDERDRNLVQRMYIEHNYDRLWLRLDNTSRQKLLLDLRPYYTERFFDPKNSITGLYWYLAYLQKHTLNLDSGVERVWKNKIELKQTRSLSTEIQEELLEYLLRFKLLNIESISFATLNSPEMARLLLLSLNTGSTIISSSAREKIIRQIASETTYIRPVYLFSQYPELRESTSGNLLANRCKAVTFAHSACLALLLKNDVAAAREFINRLKADIKSRILHDNLQALANSGLLDERTLLKEILLSDNNRLKSKTIMHLPQEVLRNHRILISSTILTEPDHTLTLILATRLQNFPELADKYCRLNSGLQVYIPQSTLQP